MAQPLRETLVESQIHNVMDCMASNSSVVINSMLDGI